MGADYRQIRFPDPDEPYLFAAALRKRFGDGALSRAWVIPSPHGPAVVVSGYLLEDAEIRRLMDLLEGEVDESASRTWVE